MKITNEQIRDMLRQCEQDKQCYLKMCGIVAEVEKTNNLGPDFEPSFNSALSLIRASIRGRLEGLDEFVKELNEKL